MVRLVVGCNRIAVVSWCHGTVKRNKVGDKTGVIRDLILSEGRLCGGILLFDDTSII